MTRQLLDGPDGVAALGQVRRGRPPKRVRTGSLGEARPPDGVLHGAPDDLQVPGPIGLGHGREHPVVPVAPAAADQELAAAQEAGKAATAKAAEAKAAAEKDAQNAELAKAHEEAKKAAEEADKKTKEAEKKVTDAKETKPQPAAKAAAKGQKK